MSKNNRLLLILLLILVAVIVIPQFFVTVIPPRSSTRSAITETFVRINMYAEKNKALPESLEVLPLREGYANRTDDAWGQPLRYEINGEDGIITISSFGKDGKPGGTGEDADISVSYYIKKPDGSLWVGSPMWIAEADLRMHKLVKQAGNDLTSRKEEQ